SKFGEQVTFTATVTVDSPGAGLPTGTVTFKDGATILGTGFVGGGGQATFSISSLAVGSHSISAEYGGDPSFNGSSDSLSQVVDKADTTTSLTSSVNPSKFGQAVTFTATVTVNGPGAGNPSGTVQFKDGSTDLGSIPVDTSTGKAVLSTSDLSVG